MVTRRSPLEGSSQNVLKNASAALAAMAEHPEVCGTQRMIAAQHTAHTCVVWRAARTVRHALRRMQYSLRDHRRDALSFNIELLFGSSFDKLLLLLAAAGSTAHGRDAAVRGLVCSSLLCLQLLERLVAANVASALADLLQQYAITTYDAALPRPIPLPSPPPPGP